jgi:GH25 family lysozyme M1 (1,4-beta-N-acetylmuramidase)
MIRGAYHFARPNVSSGATQADYFVNHGGGWSRDGKTLPGALDIEWNPYSGGTCYGLSTTGMVAWIKAFSDEYHVRTSRWPVIYTATTWWSQCTGNHGDFTATNPLWVARYASTVGTLPYAWSYYTFWQHADSGVFPGDQDTFNGALDRLQALATG